MSLLIQLCVLGLPVSSYIFLNNLAFFNMNFNIPLTQSTIFPSRKYTLF